MNWWGALDPDVQKYAAGGVVTGSIALIGTIVTFVLSGIRDSRRETVRRDADRQAESERRTADREAEDRRRQRELDDRRDAREHARAEQIRTLSVEALRESLSIAVGLVATWNAMTGRRVLTDDPSVTARMQALQTSALTVQDEGIRESMREGVGAIWGVELRADVGLLAGGSVWGEEQRILEAMVGVLAASLRGDTAQVEQWASFLKERDSEADEAYEMRYGPLD